MSLLSVDIHSLKKSRSQWLLWCVSFTLVLLLDQLTKWWGREQGMVTINTGVSLSLFKGAAAWVYAGVTILLLVVMGKWLWSIWRVNLFAWGMLCAAALSNVSDRFMFGGVQDFLPVPFIQLTNNFADWMICAVVLFVVWQFWQEHFKAK